MVRNGLRVFCLMLCCAAATLLSSVPVDALMLAPADGTAVQAIAATPPTAAVSVESTSQESRIPLFIDGESYSFVFSLGARSIPAFSLEKSEEPAVSEAPAERSDRVRFVIYHNLPSDGVSLDLGVSDDPEFGNRLSITSPEGRYVFIVRPSLRFVPAFSMEAAEGIDLGFADESPLLLAVYEGEALKAAQKGEDFEEFTVSDPLESWNRAIFKFNDKFYFWFLKPIAQGYGYVVPEWGRVRIRNIFNNALAPLRIINCLLQLRIQCATHELGRFLANSIGGVGGMFDLFMDNPELKQHDEDFGQTLGTYGVGEGIYLVWPFLGPSTARDTAGMVGDFFLNPLTYLVNPDTMLGMRAFRHVNNASLDIGTYEDLKASAVDPYVAMRDAYVQHRRAKIKE